MVSPANISMISVTYWSLILLVINHFAEGNALRNFPQWKKSYWLVTCKDSQEGNTCNHDSSELSC